MTATRLTAMLLLASGITLVLMIPGGFVETRTFPGYSIAIIAAFNVFLTALGLAAFILAVRGFRANRVGRAAMATGALFAAVYLLDLAEIFPIATTPMSRALFTLEWLGTALGLATVLAAARAMAGPQGTAQAAPLPRWAVLALLILGAGIVGFATLSAV